VDNFNPLTYKKPTVSIKGGQILVPAAAYTQDPLTGEYSVTPGIATLIVTGTI
jgi:hypothetical protein